MFRVWDFRVSGFRVSGFRVFQFVGLRFGGVEGSGWFSFGLPDFYWKAARCRSLESGTGSCGLDTAALAGSGFRSFGLRPLLKG